MPETDQHIILFDGVCNLCSGFVHFLIRRDPEARFKFASLQSETARQLLRKHGYPGYPLATIVYIKGNRSYQMSTAVLQILNTLGGFWKVLRVFGIVPKAIRDRVYRFIAQRRYQWFGKKQECMIPTPELQQRFLS